MNNPDGKAVAKSRAARSLVPPKSTRRGSRKPEATRLDYGHVAKMLARSPPAVSRRRGSRGTKDIGYRLQTTGYGLLISDQAARFLPKIPNVLAKPLDAARMPTVHGLAYALAKGWHAPLFSVKKTCAANWDGFIVHHYWCSLQEQQTFFSSLPHSPLSSPFFRACT